MHDRIFLVCPARCDEHSKAAFLSPRTKRTRATLALIAAGVSMAAALTAPLLRARPNQSLKRSANGRPPGPGLWYFVHFHIPGPGVLPSSPA